MHPLTPAHPVDFDRPERPGGCPRRTAPVQHTRTSPLAVSRCLSNPARAPAGPCAPFRAPRAAQRRPLYHLVPRLPRRRAPTRTSCARQAGILRPTYSQLYTNSILAVVLAIVLLWVQEAKPLVTV
jgi:hypothetical protein